MSTLGNLIHEPPPEPDAFEPQPAEQGEPEAGERAFWDQVRFAQEQIRGLVRQVFFPGGLKPARQVVFTAVENTDVAPICLQVGQALAAQTAGSVCVVEANLHAAESGNGFPKKGPEPIAGFDSLRNASHQISRKLWVVPPNVFLGENKNGLSAAWLRGRLGELRLEFDYTLLYAPPAGLYSEAALLGYLSDGVILVLEANSTRRAAAQKVKETLAATKTRLLGVILSERTFPIPEGIYRKL
jgi:Mrp family chromosome partitioning ATPase